MLRNEIHTATAAQPIIDKPLCDTRLFLYFFPFALAGVVVFFRSVSISACPFAPRSIFILLSFALNMQIPRYVSNVYSVFHSTLHAFSQHFMKLFFFLFVILLVEFMNVYFFYNGNLFYLFFCCKTK